MKNCGIVIKNMNVSIGNFQLLTDVNATFKPGTATALIGPNGAGKTTFFNAMTGFVHNISGTVLYNDINLKHLSTSTIARAGVGRLFQDVRVFGQMSVADNLAVAQHKPYQETVSYSFMRFVAQKKGTQKSQNDTIDYWLNEIGLYRYKDKKASDLSFGQQKLLGIVRLLIMQSQVLLLDEPTAGLNVTMRSKLLNLIDTAMDESHSRIIVVIEHDMNFIRDICPWTYFMQNGTITHYDKTDTILKEREIRKKYIGY